MILAAPPDPSPLGLVSEVFVSILVGLSFSEMLACLRTSVHERGIRLDDLFIFVTFFSTGIRFFIGNQLYLATAPLESGTEIVWFFDFVTITTTSVILVLMGSVSSVGSSRSSKLGIYPLLITLYVADVLWVLLHVLIHAQSAGGGDRPPLAWAVLNTILIVVIVAIIVWARERCYSKLALGGLMMANLAAFFVDLYLVIVYRVVGG